MNPADNGYRNCCYAGIAAAVVFSVGWVLGVLWDPSWTFGEDTLSKMGVSDVGATAATFLVSCVATAALGMVFELGKAVRSEGADRASAYLAAAALVFLAGLGIFNMGYNGGDIHRFCAVAFFAVIVLSMVVSTYHDAVTGQTAYAAFTGIAVAVMAVTGAVSQLALTEAVAVMGVMAWVVSQSLKVLMSKT